MEIFFFENAALVLFIIICLITLVIYLSILLKKSEESKKSIEIKFNEISESIENINFKGADYKLNPHLFKNILNSIQSHAYQTYITIDKLSYVLDYMLYKSNQKYVTPHEEIEFGMNLIEINKVKLSPLFELKVKRKVNEGEPMFNQRLLAPLISVELIENAFKHADLQKEDSFISITYGFNDCVFSLNVANKVSSVAPIKKDKSGIGLEMMENRLKLIYKENYKLDTFVEDNIHISHLKINLLEHKAKMLATG